MPQLRLNEHYTSVQGEGPHVGILTQFVRFSGCNMRCPGWPCDTQHAIIPALWKDDPKYKAENLHDKIDKERAATGARNICLTGGEPFMQDASELHVLVRRLLAKGYYIDIFTNGSFPFPPWIANMNVSIIMDWKLPGSGEANTKLEQRTENYSRLRNKDAVKFVVKDLDDIEAAVEVYLRNGSHCETFIGRVWDSKITDDDIVEFLKFRRLNWRLNVQMHKLIWPGVERGI